MIERQALTPAVERLLIHQAKVVTKQQATEAGMTRHALARLVRDGRWSSLSYGIYCASLEASWDARAWAGCLIGGENARLGAQASAYLFKLASDPPEPIDVLVPWTSKCRPREAWTFIRERSGARGAGTTGSPPRLTVEDTVLDLCEVGTEADVVTWVTKAVQRRLVKPDALLTSMETRQRLRHRRLLRDLLSDVAEGAESGLELHYLRDVERAHGLPKGHRQKSSRGLPYCSDVRYDAYDVLVELDGRDGHEAEGRFRDMKRDNHFVVEGDVTLRYGWFDTTDHPCEVAWQVAGVLVNRGWPGLPTRCPRCQNVPGSLGN